MSGFIKQLEKDGTYHAPGEGGQWELRTYSDDDVSEWANDSSCIDHKQCAAELARRVRDRAIEEERLTNKHTRLIADPFDQKTEVSADARYIASRIVTTLWIIFVLIPVVGAILYLNLK